MKKEKRLIGIMAYAALCQVSVTSILQREKAGHLKFTLHKTKKNVAGNPVKMIDIKKYPPLPAQRRGLKP